MHIKMLKKIELCEIYFQLVWQLVYLLWLMPMAGKLTARVCGEREGNDPLYPEPNIIDCQYIITILGRHLTQSCSSSSPGTVSNLDNIARRSLYSLQPTSHDMYW